MQNVLYVNNVISLWNGCQTSRHTVYHKSITQQRTQRLRTQLPIIVIVNDWLTVVIIACWFGRSIMSSQPSTIEPIYHSIELTNSY